MLSTTVSSVLVSPSTSLFLSESIILLLFALQIPNSLQNQTNQPIHPFLLFHPNKWRIPTESSTSISRAASTPHPPLPPSPPRHPDPLSITTPPRPPPPWPTVVPPPPPQSPPLRTTRAAGTFPDGGASGRRCAGTGSAACA